MDNLINNTLKVVLTVTIASSLVVGLAIYSKINHSGPSCSSNKESITAWLTAKSAGGKVVSVHEDKIQTTNGTTTCFGYYFTESGEYKGWVAELIAVDGGIIGRVGELTN